MKIEKLLPGVQKNIPLAQYTSFNIGGPADYFFQAQTKRDLIKAVEAAIAIKLPFFILGKGSNVLASDESYRGLVIKVKSKKSKVKSYDSGIEIVYEAGALLKDLVAKTAELNLAGLQWAAGIPGTIGGALRGNAGAFAKSIGDSVKEVEVLEILDNKTEIKKYSKKECNFSYRNSIFKKKRNLIILSVVFQLRKGDNEKIEKQTKENLDHRRINHPLNFPSAGSVFKNPAPVRRKELGRGKPHFIQAAQLIEKCGLKGKKIGQAQISEKHCNFIINLGGAKAEDVKKLINLAREKVKQKFKINLEKEIVYLNF